MLGSAMVAALQGTDGLRVTATSRSAASASLVPFRSYSVGSDGLDALVAGLGPADYVVNCIGVVKRRIDDRSVSDRLEAIRVNSTFPHELALRAEGQGFRVIQIATDCVYSGTRGDYDESAMHDPVDVYGRTKGLGEVPHDLFLNLRCSIIGREVADRQGLVEWLLSQPRNGTIQGYVDHRWNGVTTPAFAALVRGLILGGTELSGTHHFVPADAVDKNELSTLILAAFDRQDVTVEPTVTGHAIDRTLSTLDSELNAAHWRLAGYAVPPSIAQLVAALP